MEFNKLSISGAFEVQNFIARDSRGVFVKTFHGNEFNKIGYEGNFLESYYSQSFKSVIRGMHFQTPPQDHEKLVYVVEGKILDVILDLRSGSLTYGKCVSVELNAFGNSVFIPKGCAHGFLTLSETATVVYNVTTVYDNKHDSGVAWNSFGFDWGVETPIISERDKSFDSLNHFKSPFL